MQRHDDHPHPSADTRASEATGNPASATKKPAYVPPVIPMGLPHVVQYVTGSLLHMPAAFQLMADRMSRYGNTDGEVSIALEFLCKISDLGSKNTAKGYIDKLAAMDVLETVHGQGGNDRKSNTYRFLGAKRNWRPLPGEEPGTDPWLTLLEVRLENEDLKQKVQDLTARLELLTNGAAIGHPTVTDGDRPTNPGSYETPTPETEDRAIDHSRVTNGEASDPAPTPADSYEPPGSSRPQGRAGSIGHSEVTNGAAVPPAETGSDSYENTVPNRPQGDDGAIGHSEVTNGSGATEADSYETPTPQGYDGAIGHSTVTDGRPPPAAGPGSHSYEDTGSTSPQGESESTGYSEVTNGLTEGEVYLARRARVEPLVTEFRGHYQVSFRGGVPSAVHYFSESDSKETELRAQVETLRAEAQAAAARPPPEAEDPAQAGRRGVEYCPECDSPFTTHDGADYCPDCTDRRRRGGGGS